MLNYVCNITSILFYGASLASFLPAIANPGAKLQKISLTAKFLLNLQCPIMAKLKTITTIVTRNTMTTINIRGRLMEFTEPKVMGILNVTPDSFYSGCRAPGEEAVAERVCRIRDEGADIIDIGGCSTRPGSDPVDAATEWERLASGLRITRRLWPDAVISIDTLRAEVARRGVLEGADIINDVSGGSDPEMPDVVADMKVPYVLTHNAHCKNQDAQGSLAEVLTNLAYRLRDFRQKGVCDVIIDPGFGFGKDVEQNYHLMAGLEEFTKFGLPLLVGISRKTMIWKPLGITPADALPGTIALNMYALQKGADILRVHDVAAAVQTREVYERLRAAE